MVHKRRNREMDGGRGKFEMQRKAERIFGYNNLNNEYDKTGI